MPFQPEKAKKQKVTKSLYLTEELAETVEKLASANNTSFNNMVVSLIEYCLKEMEQN